MAQLTVDVSMTDAMSLSGMQQGSPSPRHAGVAAAAGQWEMARGNATASDATPACTAVEEGRLPRAVQVLVQATVQATVQARVQAREQAMANGNANGLSLD